MNVVLFFWFLRLFKPEWIASHYVPALGLLKPIPTLLLLIFILVLVARSSSRLVIDVPMACFATAIALSTINSANLGLSFPIMRGVFETLIIYTAISAFINSWTGITKLFAIYFASFIFFGVWGIAEGGLVRQHMPLSDEDSFGPFMSIGFGMSYFLLRWRGWRNERKLVLVAVVISLAGAISSFARGTFVALAGVVTLFFIRAREKVLFLAAGVMAALLALALAWVVVPEFVQEYYEEVSTIWTGGTKEKTANDRLYLWTRGLAMFRDHPILGVGPGCFGYRLPSYITSESAREWGVRFQMYGRAIHNIYLEILATTGLVGSLALAGLLASFRARNVSIRQARVPADVYLGLGRKRESCPQVMLRCSLALEAGMVAFLINGVFFNILDYTWFWDLLILNTLVFRWAKTAERGLCR